MAHFKGRASFITHHHMKKTAFALLIISTLIAVLPLLSILMAGAAATMLGCDLNEGSISECPTIFGDAGETLYIMGVFGWFLFYTVPLGGIGIVVSLCLFVAARIRLKRSL